MSNAAGPEPDGEPMPLRRARHQRRHPSALRFDVGASEDRPAPEPPAKPEPLVPEVLVRVPPPAPAAPAAAPATTVAPTSQPAPRPDPGATVAPAVDAAPAPMQAAPVGPVPDPEPDEPPAAFQLMAVPHEDDDAPGFRRPGPGRRAAGRDRITNLDARRDDSPAPFPSLHRVDPEPENAADPLPGPGPVDHPADGGGDRAAPRQPAPAQPEGAPAVPPAEATPGPPSSVAGAAPAPPSAVVAEPAPPAGPVAPSRVVDRTPRSRAAAQATLPAGDPDLWRRLVTECGSALELMGGPTSVGVTSCVRGEGRSTIAVSMALAQTRRYRSTILLEADVEQPSLARILGLDEGPGVAEVLRGEAQLPDCVQMRGNLGVIPAGHVGSEPSLLSAQLLSRDLATELRQLCDAMVIDLPPFLGPGVGLARSCPKVVLVVRAGATPLDRMERVATELGHPPAILNQAEEAVPRWMRGLFRARR